MLNNKEKVKIGFLFYGEGSPSDTKHWSGTIAALRSTLQKSERIDLDDIVIRPSKIIQIVLKLIRKLSFNLFHFSFLMLFADSAKISKIIRESKCDYYFAPAGSQVVYLGRKALKNRKLIYLSDATYHAMLGYYYNHSKHDQFIRNKIDKTAQELSEAIIYPSRWVINDAINFYKTPREKIHFVRLGANMEDNGFKVIKPGKEKYKLLLVGVDYERKGVDIAIEAVRLLNETSSSIKYELSVVGLNKPDKPIPDYVTFYGKLRKNNKEELKKLIEWYENHDIFIMPTKAECAGIVFAEAAMFGIPSFTYATGGTVDYVEDGVTGRCIEANLGAEAFCETIREAVTSGKIEEYSINARQKYETEMNWDCWLEQFEAIIG